MSDLTDFSDISAPETLEDPLVDITTEEPIDIFSDTPAEESEDIFTNAPEADPLPDDTLNPDDITIHPQKGPEYEPTPEGEPLETPCKPEPPEGWTPGGPER